MQNIVKNILILPNIAIWIEYRTLFTTKKSYSFFLKNLQQNLFQQLSVGRAWLISEFLKFQKWTSFHPFDPAHPVRASYDPNLTSPTLDAIKSHLQFDFSLFPYSQPYSGPRDLLLPKETRYNAGIRGLRARTNYGGKTLAVFFHTIANGFFCRMDDQTHHDEWHQGSGSTSNAGGRESNPSSASVPSVRYRGQSAPFPPEFFAPQQSGGSQFLGARRSHPLRGSNRSRGRGGLGQGSGTSSGVQAPTQVGQLPPPNLADWMLQDLSRPLDTTERRDRRCPTES